MPVSCFGLLPTLYEQSDLLFSPNQRGQSSRHSHVEMPPSAAFLQDAVYVEGLSHTSERLCSQVLAGKIPLHQAIGGFAYGHRIGLSETFDA